MSTDMDRAMNTPWWRRGTTLIAAAIMLITLLGLTAFAMLQSKRSVRIDASALTVATAETGQFHDFAPLSGKAAPREIIYLDALEGGQVEQVLVQAGDQVTKGQSLIAFRNTTLELEVLDREGRLIESITQLQTYEKSLEQNRAENEKALAQIDYDTLRLSRSVERREVLAAKGVVPLEQRDQVRDELTYAMRLRPLQLETNNKQEELRRTQAPRIHAELEGLQQSLVITRNKLEALVVKAPVSGQVTAIDLKIGQNRNRGDRLAEITPNTGFKVSVDIDEYYLTRVRPGQLADVVIDGLSYRLVVKRVFPQVSSGRFAVDLDFAGPQPGGLIPGQAVQGQLSLGNDRRALLLPAGPFLERSGGSWAFVLSRNGHQADRRPIRLGRRNSDQVEVLSGLSAGDRVITSDYTGLEKLSRVIIKQ